MPVLEGRGIVKQFSRKASGWQFRIGSVTAVDTVDLALEAGKTVGVVGESGSGKTTLGEILGDLQRPTAGTVLYAGRDIRSLNPAEYRVFRRNVQYVFQSPKESMNPYFRIERILLEPMSVLLDGYEPRVARHAVREMLERVGLEASCADKYPSELSGGQCQRVAIARALLPTPQIIVCDECVSALDVSVQAQILNLLKDLQREFRTAYLFISHDIGVVNYVADEIVVMHKGKIVERGERQTLINAPRDPYTKTLISSSFDGR